MNREIEFQKIKNSIIEDLKQDDRFKDYNYSGSNLSAIMDLLSKNTHFMGFYANMIWGESNPLTATQLDSLKGHASKLSYLIKNYRSAACYLNIKVKVTSDVSTIFIAKNTKFTSVNPLGENVTFITPTDITLDAKTADNYIYGTIKVIEGELKVNTFIANTSKKFYTIKDIKCDESTLKVSTKQTSSSVYELIYQRADGKRLPQYDDKIYYIKLDGDYYKLFFGDDVFGYQPKTNEIIKVEYISSKGATGNGAFVFKIVLNPNTDKTDINSYTESNISITCDEQSSGGASEVNMNDLKILLSNYSRIKNVAINDNDYKQTIIDNTGDIASIAVWGGEKNITKSYGKLFISIKPLYGNKLSSIMKDDIKKYLYDSHSLTGDNITFVDPDYMKVNVKVFSVRNAYARNMSVEMVKSDIVSQSKLYDSEQLGKFEVIFNEKKYIEYITANYPDSYQSLYTRKEMVYELSLLYGNDRNYSIDFNNQISSFISSKFKYGSKTAYFTYNTTQNGVCDIVLNVDGVNYFNDYGTVNFDSGKVDIFIPENVLTESIIITTVPVSNNIISNYDRIIKLGKVEVEVK